MLGFGSLAECFYVFLELMEYEKLPQLVRREDDKCNVDVTPLQLKTLDARSGP